MAGFRKAEAKQAYLKMGIYGPSGSGKTFTSLLVAEGLAARAGKRVAVVDTERGTDFYCQSVPSRRTHPEAFDFDAMYTRAIAETIKALYSLDSQTHGVVVIDSITHLWEACKLAYQGKETRAGTIPMHAWNKIKKPYKDLMTWFMNSNFHCILCGRQGIDYAEDEDSGELKSVGVKMKAEGETAYEPHILLRMEAVKTRGKKEPVYTAFAEKDRTGILAGRLISLPSFESIGAPLLPVLGGVQAQIQSDDEVGAQDAEALARQEREKEVASRITREKFEARLKLASDVKAVESIGREITPELKRTMTPADVTALRESYLAAMDHTKKAALQPAGNGKQLAEPQREPGVDEE